MTTRILAFTSILAWINVVLMIVFFLKKYRESATLAGVIAGVALVLSLLYFFVGDHAFSVVVQLTICVMWVLTALRLYRRNSL